MRIRTERLELSPVEPGDAAELHAFFLDRDVRRYMLDGAAMPRSWIDEMIAESGASFAQIGLGVWAVRERDLAPIIGVTGYREFRDPPVLEVLWALLPAHWSRGLATEMARTVIDVGFASGLGVIRVSTDTPNQASVRVMKRLGMRFDGRGAGARWEQVHYVLERPAGASGPP